MRVVLVAALCAIVPVAGMTRTVVVAVQDPLGNLIPNLRPENFAVYEGGVRQRDVTADVQHASITLAVLIEGGGRYQTYASSGPDAGAGNVRVELIDPTTGAPLPVAGASGKRITPTLVVGHAGS